MTARMLGTLGMLGLLSFVTANAAAREPRIRPNAGSCTIVEIDGCDVAVPGTLESGDCLGSAGTRIDYFTFHGTAGQIVDVMVRPLSPAYKQPIIALFSPLGDQAEPPIVGGGDENATASGAEILYQLSSTGTWEIAISSDDLFASGDYVLHLNCFQDDTPGGPQSCVEQYLLCGQTATWSLSADSCRFSSVSKAYAEWFIYAVKGDFLEFEQESFAFTPLFGIYDAAGRLLKSSTKDGSFHARLNYVVPETGWYSYLTTSVEDNKGGTLSVKLDCRASGCTFPYLVSPVANATVKRGETAVIPFTVNAVGGFSTELLNLDFIPVASVPTETTSITTPPVLGPTNYTLAFDNACGDWRSNVFTVSPETTRRRSVRK